MDREAVEQTLLNALCEFYAKQGIEVTEELYFALDHTAEFLASALVAEMRIKG